MMPWFRSGALIGLVSLLSLLGCIETDIPPAGSYSEVLLVTEEGARDPLAKVVLPHLAKTIDFFVSEDTQFKVQHARAAELDEVPYVKNIVYCGAATPVSHVGRRITSLLGEGGIAKVRSGEASIFKKENLPGAGQLTVIVTAPSEDAVFEIVAERGDELNEALESSCRQRLRNYLLENKNKQLAQRLRQKYGFRVEIPSLYELLSDEPQPPGVELLRDGPPRSLGIFWLDREETLRLEDQRELFDARARYVYERYDGDTMDSTRVRFSYDRLGPYPAVKMEGYWSNSNSLAGGYYMTYFVHDERERLLWVVDLLVYAPGLPKHPLFRELLAIAETFRYR